MPDNVSSHASDPIPDRCLHCPAFRKIILVHDIADGGAELARELGGIGFRVQKVAGWTQACEQINELDCEFVVWDAPMPSAEDMDALRQLRQRCPRLPIIVLVDSAEAETAIGLMKAGAHDFLVKPVDDRRLLDTVEQVIHSRRRFCDALLLATYPSPTLQGERGGEGRRLVGCGRALQEVYRRIGLVAERNEPVLIHGETGTGKELVARAIHEHSQRRQQVFLAINCAALPESLLESELFGHEKGAFTGAGQQRLGAFETANGGTLFLDEIGDMSLPLQAKILRALQQGEIRRLGGHQTIAVDVRVLAATNKDLEKAIWRGGFREDLYYPLNVVSIRMPPLREHAEDILPLVEHFIERYTPPGEARPALDTRALRKLQAYHWPGNVRELENTVRRALVSAKAQVILEENISLPVRPDLEPATCCCQEDQPLSGRSPAEPRNAVSPDLELDMVLEKWLAQQMNAGGSSAEASVPARMEIKLLLAALNLTSGNQVQAARLLGISRSTLREWLKKRAGETEEKGRP
jgi:DNA-binding NtrC family response regulator